MPHLTEEETEAREMNTLVQMWKRQAASHPSTLLPDLSSCVKNTIKCKETEEEPDFLKVDIQY